MNEELDAVFKDVNSSLPQRKIVQLIERTNLSADMKALLSDLARLTIKIGGKILAIGRKILTFIFDVIKLLPGITLGVLAAIVISSIIGAIPIIGAVLAAFLSPILLAAGISLGALKDMTNDKLGEKLDKLIGSFSPLKEV